MAEAMKKEEGIDNFFEDWLPDVDYNMKSNLAPEVQSPHRKPNTIEKPKTEIKPLEKPEPAVHRKRDISRVLFLCSAVIFLIGTMGIVTSYSEVYSKRAQIENLNTELEEAKEITMILSEVPDLNMTMAEVYEYAKEELGMQEATAEDTVFIQTEPHTYTQINEPAEDSKERVTFHWFS